MRFLTLIWLAVLTLYFVLFYGYISAVLEVARRILHPIRTCIRLQSEGSIGVEEITKVNVIMDEMALKLKSLSTEFNTLVKKSKETAVNKMKAFMSSDMAKTAITSWNRDDIPQPKLDENISDLKERLRETVEVRISSTMNKWENETRCVTLEIENIFNFVYKCQYFLQEKGGELERCMQTGLVNMDMSKDLPPSKMSPEMKAELSNFLRSKRMSSLIGSLALGAVFAGLFGLLGVCVYSTVKSIKFIIGKYKCDPELYVKDMAKDAMKHFQAKSTIEEIVNDRFEPLLTYFAKDVVDVGEKRLEANRKLIASLTRMLRAENPGGFDSIVKYQDLEKRVLSTLQLLNKFSIETLRNYTTTLSDVCTPDEYTWHSGLLGRFTNACLKDSCDVTVKSYTARQDIHSKLNEEHFLT